MDNEMFKKAFLESFERKIQKRYHVFSNANYNSLTDLTSIVFEINKCIVLELYMATITLTNHFLERLLKLALIYNDVGRGTITLEKLNEVYSEPHKKYSKISLNDAINFCREFSIITTGESDFLHETIRKQVRNGFSHADPGMILKNVSKQDIFIQGSFSDPKKNRPFKLNQTEIPFIQSILIADFAKENAEYYFDSIFDLSKKIDNRLTEKADAKIYP
ncbi:hypothetical protein CMU32_12335 [Elizabethkingia anophelis]|nr:hypothetical protein [Elizabethkingia anophelis]